MAWTKDSLKEAVQRQLGDQLFLIVSNREPYIHRIEGGEILCQVPPGGLTVALDPVMRACGGLWIAHGVGEADRMVVDAHDHVRVPPDDPSYTLRRIWLTKHRFHGERPSFKFTIPNLLPLKWQHHKLTTTVFYT